MLGIRMGFVFALASINVAQTISNSTGSGGSASTTPTPSFANSSTTTFVSSSVTSSFTLNATSTARANGTGEFCNAQQISWSLASKAYSSSHPVVATATNTRNYTSTIFSTQRYNCTRMCDTICYAGPVDRTVSTTAIYEEYPVTYTTGAEYPTPSPNCSIGFSDCLSMQSKYTTEFSSYWSLPYSSRSLTTSPIQPSCSACVSTSCAFQHGGMSLYYWPITTSVSRDWCAWDPVGGIASTYVPDINHTYVPTTTGPYAVVDGITMYQGNVYLSLHEPFVRDNCGKQITRASLGHNILTIASSDLYSVRKYPHNLYPWPVNYDDFNKPVAWSAYYGGRYCANNRPLCSVVFPDSDPEPVMIMPPQIRDLDPNWRTCSFDQYGIWDPPVALHSVGNMFSSSAKPEPTPPSDPDPVVTPPTPGQTGGNGLPVVTPPPNSDPDPPNNDPSDPPNNDPSDPPNNNDPPSNNNPNPNPGPNPAPNPGPNPTNPAPNPPQNAPPPVITVGPTVVPVDPTGGVVINPGTTISRGGAPVVISSTTFSIGDQGLTIISPSTSTQIPFNNGPVTVPLGPGNAPITLDPQGTVVFAPGTTLHQGDPAITVSGTTLSIGPSGIVVVGPQGTSTIPIPAGDPNTPQIITVGSQTYTLTNGELILGPGTTIGFGDPAVTVSGITYSVGSSGIVVIGPSGTSTIAAGIPSQVITVGGETYTVIGGELVLGPGTTIGVGDPAVTVDGTTYSVGPTGVVILSDGGGTTVPVTGTGSGSGANPTGAFTGGGGKIEGAGRGTYEMVVIVGLVAMML